MGGSSAKERKRVSFSAWSRKGRERVDVQRFQIRPSGVLPGNEPGDARVEDADESARKTSESEVRCIVRRVTGRFLS